MATEMAINISEEGRVVLVTFTSATIHNSDEINTAGEQIKDYINRKRPERMVFDFANVKFFSSQVLGLLLDIRSKLEEHNGSIVISSINPQLHRVFRITNLNTVFKFFPDKNSAVKEGSS